MIESCVLLHESEPLQAPHSLWKRITEQEVETEVQEEAMQRTAALDNLFTVPLQKDSCHILHCVVREGALFPEITAELRDGRQQRSASSHSGKYLS